MPSMSATSVFGRSAIHSAPRSGRTSPRSGETLTNATPGVRRLAHALALDMPSGAAVVDLAVLHRQPAERDQQVRVLDDRRPARVKGKQPEHLPQDVRQDDLACREAVGLALVRVSADAVEEAPELVRRVVELSGARPPVGAGEDGAVAVRGDHPPELARDEPARLLPRHRDERLGAALRAIRTGAVREPPLAHHRLRDPAGIVEGVDHAVRDRGRIGIVLEAVQRGQPAVAHHRAVRAPVGRRQGEVAVRRASRRIHGSMPRCPCRTAMVPAIRRRRRGRLRGGERRDSAIPAHRPPFPGEADRTGHRRPAPGKPHLPIPAARVSTTVSQLPTLRSGPQANSLGRTWHRPTAGRHRQPDCPRTRSTPHARASRTNTTSIGQPR